MCIKSAYKLIEMEYSSALLRIFLCLISSFYPRHSMDTSHKQNAKSHYTPTQHGETPDNIHLLISIYPQWNYL